MTTKFELIKSFADTVGIEPHYMDNWGRKFYTDPVTAEKILRVKGVRIDEYNEPSITETLVCAVDEIPDKIPFTIRERIHPSLIAEPEGRVRVLNEKSEERTSGFAPDQAEIDVDEKTGLTVICAPAPDHSEIGIHRLTAEIDFHGASYRSELTLIVCPAKAYMPPEIEGGRKLAGIQIALYGVRSEVNWGVGDFGDLWKIVDWAADDLGVDCIGLNPLHALGNTRPYNHSPYNPSSRYYRNFIYLDATGIPDFPFCAKAAAILESPEAKRILEGLRNEEHVDYEGVAAFKLRILREVYRSFMENQGSSHLGAERWQEFQDYVTAEGEYLERFAVFCALEERFKARPTKADTWREWPREFQDPDSPAVRKFQVENQEETLFWMYLQWQIHNQMKSVQEYARSKGMLIGLYHDEALAVDRNGADFWARREFFHEEFKVGAPPDAFAPDGQDWGFPPPNREKLKAAAYEPFLRKLQASCRHGGALRIDHVMQLHHLFWIPADGKPKDGVYVKEHEADLLNLLALESVKNNTLIIGEDLGTVPYDFRDRLMKKGALSYRLFYFEQDRYRNQTPFWDYPQAALVSISTHDLPTLSGFWTGADIDLRVGIGMLDSTREAKFREERVGHKAKIIERLVQDGCLPAHVAHAAWIEPFPTDELHTATLKFTLQTPAKLVVIAQEDLFLDLRQQNLPGTTWERPNWVTKMKYTVEQLREDPEAVRLCRKFRGIVEESGRALGRSNP